MSGLVLDLVLTLDLDSDHTEVGDWRTAPFIFHWVEGDVNIMRTAPWDEMLATHSVKQLPHLNNNNKIQDYH